MWLTVLGFIVMGLVSVLSLADHSDSGFFLVVHALQRQGDVSKKDSGMWSISWCFLLTSPELFQLVQFSSVVQLCPTLCDAKGCSTPGLPVHHQLPQFTQMYVHWVGDAIQPSFIPFSSCLQSFPPSGSFQVSQFFTSGGQTIGVSASTSVLLMNIQD